MFPFIHTAATAAFGAVKAVVNATTEPDPRLAPVVGDDIDDLVNASLAREDRR